MGLGRELEEYQVWKYLSGVLLTLNLSKLPRQGYGELLAECSYLQL